ncbi:hypothetical protein BDZ89DRAFT_33362 [Hymenopellis radicata]|nr:hypothetical protein BDZ89DRAFT_33362 [Hymenopellis radicata]
MRHPEAPRNRRSSNIAVMGNTEIHSTREGSRGCPGVIPPPQRRPSTTWPINALDCGLLEIVVHAVACFGTNRLLPCGPMPLLLKYIADWCLRSKRVAVRLHDALDGLRNDQVLWNSLPPVSAHPLTAGWYTFLDTLRDTMTVMPVTGRLLINCMNENCLAPATDDKDYMRCTTCRSYVVCSPNASKRPGSTVITGLKNAMNAEALALELPPERRVYTV